MLVLGFLIISALALAEFCPHILLRRISINPHYRVKGVRTPANLEPQSPHFGAVPLFLMCRYRSSPPGVLTTRTLFDLVL